MTQVFSCKFCEVFNNTFFTEYLWSTASAFWIIMKKKLALSNFETSKLLIQNFQKFRELNITELNDTSQITVRFDERRNFLKKS